MKVDQVRRRRSGSFRLLLHCKVALLAVSTWMLGLALINPCCAFTTRNTRSWHVKKRFASSTVFHGLPLPSTKLSSSFFWASTNRKGITSNREFRRTQSAKSALWTHSVYSHPSDDEDDDGDKPQGGKSVSEASAARSYHQPTSGTQGQKHPRRAWRLNRGTSNESTLSPPHSRHHMGKFFLTKVRAMLKKVLIWQRSKRRSLLAAAAVSFALIFGSYHHHGSMTMTHPLAPKREIHRTMASSSSLSLPSSPMSPSVLSLASSLQETPSYTWSSLAARGGSEAAVVPDSSPVQKKKFFFWQGEPKTLDIEEAMATAKSTTTRTLREAMLDLANYMRGPKSDTLLLLLATALITPVCKRLGTSPILGFLASGMLLGPNGCGLISGIHTTETLADLGIVFFLFEMGIELSFERLLSMRKDVFGLGFLQFITTAVAVALVSGLVGGLPANAMVVVGGGLALSSSAFVLQLLKDKDQLATRFGKAAFGVLLFQDLAVVPLLVVTPILAGGSGGQDLASALTSAVIKAAMALGSIAFAGRILLNPMFKTVAQAQSQEAFLGVILLTVLSMSFLTEGLGLSNTLGAFLAGVLLSETKYRYQVEADIAPFRGVLLGLFFVTVGFEIDVHLIASNLPLVSGIVLGILALKAFITTMLSLAFGLSLSTSQQTGLILSQGGEFAFVTFGLARSLGLLDQSTTKLMLTCVSLTMALTPLMSGMGSAIAKRLEESSDFTHYLGQDRDANEIKESDDFVVVVGYGAVGKVVCNMLDRKLIKYVGIDINPNKAIQARNMGLPVFYGDVGRQEVAEAFNIGNAKAAIVCISEKAQTNRVVIALRRWYPELKIFCRAMDSDHRNRLQTTLDVVAMVPILPEDNVLLTLPFAGSVLKSLGYPAEEVNTMLEVKRKEVLQGRGLEENEMEMALLQLGIDPEQKSAAKIGSKVSTRSGEDSSKNDEEEVVIGDIDKHEQAVAAAAERVEETKEKSPLVASVIEEVCPDLTAESTSKEKDNDDETLLTIASDGATTISISSTDDSELAEVLVPNPSPETNLTKTEWTP